MKLKKDQQRWLGHIREHATARGMTLGRGKPHDRRTVQTLIDLYLISPLWKRPDVLQCDYATRSDEDKNGLALMIDDRGDVYGATHWGVRVLPFSDAEYTHEKSGDALQNGIDTAWELYPHDETRREWMQWAVAQSTLAMYE